MGDTSVLNPSSPGALAISNLFNITMGIATIILIIVTVWLVYNIIRYRARPGDAEPRQIYGLPRLEIAWTIVPFLILIVLFGLTISAIGQSDPEPPQNAQPEIEIIGHQWWWEVRYPQANVITANEIHLPANQSVLARMVGADVIHDFWVPRLGRKMDMIPNHPVNMYLQPADPGVYFGACAEFCGTEHAWMLLQVIVQPQDQYQAWLKANAQPSVQPTAANVTHGMQLFSQKTCISCHAIAGMAGGNANAQVGPNLTHIGSRNTIGAGRLQNTPENMAKWLENPQAMKPGILMPNLQLSPDEVRDLTAYMESLK